MTATNSRREPHPSVPSYGSSSYWALVLLLAAASLSGCFGGWQSVVEVRGETFRLTEVNQLGEDRPIDRGRLHPAVIERLLLAPELSLIDDSEPEAEALRAEAARRLAPTINMGLSQMGSVWIYGPDGDKSINLYISEPGRLVVAQFFHLVSLAGAQGENPYYVLDLASLPEGFDARANLSVETVREMAPFFRGDS